jgi:hypothetical protein
MGAELLIRAWEVRLLRLLQDAELDADSPDMATSPTLRTVADRLAELSSAPSNFDLVAAMYDSGYLAQTWSFATALSRVLDRLAPPDPSRARASISSTEEINDHPDEDPDPTFLDP